MVRVGLSVEGSTEERFVKSVLYPYFSNRNIYITPISMRGNISVDRIRGEIEKLLYNFDFVSTFYDFYGFKGKQEYETKETLEKKMSDSIREELKSKFIPYLQMYEFEGLLFSSPAAIASNLQEKALEKWAAGILSAFDNNPERINDSKETAPSKRLEQKTIYRKTTHGPNIAKEIGLDKMREMCTEFNAWLIRLEGLAV